MRLFDTARQAVTPIEPRGERVGIYVCGITPYDSAHLGHAFVFHVFDLVARRLTALGADVRSVRNVTDVDDDILRVARERGVDYRELGDDQVRRFDRDMAGIGLQPVTSAPRATAHVPRMVAWITRLEQAGRAYARDGWVYFDTSAHREYGSLSRLDREQMLALSALRGGDPHDPRKRDPLDFVLWQPSREGEPSWASPWSDGRPGWHIECTVLASDELGTPVDIHGGGDDLIFPHHESELAQAQAAGVSPYVRHWVHVAMVRHLGEKMSKSLGNLVFVSDLLQRVGGPAVRLLLAAHHYRASWTYDEEELHDAEDRRVRYGDALRGRIDDDAAAAYEARFFERIDDDLDTPGALRILDEAARSALSGAPAAAGGPGQDALARMLSALGAHPASVPV